MRIFTGVPLAGATNGGGVVESTTVILDDLGGYFFGIFRNKAGNII